MNNILEATLQIKDAHNEGVISTSREYWVKKHCDESGKQLLQRLLQWNLVNQMKVEEDQRMKYRTYSM